MIEAKVVCTVLFVVWADLRLAFWKLSDRLDKHIGGGEDAERPALIERRKHHA